MPKVNTFNYDTIASWNGTQDLFVVEQPDGTKVATPAMVKQFIEAGDFEATGEIKDGHGNILANMAKADDVDAEIGDLSQTGLTGDSVAEQLVTVGEQIAKTSHVVSVNAVNGQSPYSWLQYVKFGKVVIMSGFIAGGSDYMRSGTKVFEGLPKPVTFTEIFAVQNAGNGYKRFSLNTSGEIYCYDTTLTVTNNINFYVCYVYV